MTQHYYTSATVKFGKVLYRGYSVEPDGTRKRVQQRIDYKPTLYVETQEAESAYNSMYGKPLAPKKFKSIPEAREFVKSFEEVMPIYGYQPSRFEYNFLIEYFPEKLELGVSDINLASVDIETTTEHGKIDTVNTPEEITLITYQNVKTKVLTTWGSRPSYRENYVLCKNEQDVIQHFVRHVENFDPDIITGWNVAGFDIPYIINRGSKILGGEYMNKLSPFGLIDVKDEEVRGKAVQKFTIVGRTVLDLLELYLKFTFVKRVNNKLETIAMAELGAGKLKNPVNTFREFYTGEFDVTTEPSEDAHELIKLGYERTKLRAAMLVDGSLLKRFTALDNEIKQKAWDLFVEYNQIDTIRVSELEDKLGLIALAMAVAYKAKINFGDVYGPVKIWECMILGTLYKENKYAPVYRKRSASNGIEGAYVHTPKPGFVDWIISIDAEALYPSVAVGCNMSPETFLGMNPDCTVASLLGGASFAGESYAIAANGSMYSKDKQGIIPRIMQEIKDERNTSKREMLDAKQLHIDTGDDKYKKISIIKGTNQLAMKVLNNSGYGAISQSGFLFFDNRIAEGITMTGQYIIQYVSRHFNTRLNDFFKTKDVNYVVYMDTDSSFFTLGNIVKKYYADKTDEEIVTALDNLMEKHLRALINEATDHIAAAQNYYKKTIYFKREKICSSGFWMAPKKYALKVYDNEGVRYKTPDYAITGIEVVRSSTPQLARDALKECVILVINKDIEGMRKIVAETYEKFMTAPSEDIAFPRGVNNLLAYSSDQTIYSKGTPIAVRGALLHNHFLEKLNLENQYQPIEEGGKILFMYIKEPNPFKENVVAFIDKIPFEFNLEQYVDREMMFEKVFEAPLNGIMKAVGWHMKEQASLDEFF